MCVDARIDMRVDMGIFAQAMRAETRMTMCIQKMQSRVDGLLRI